MGCQPAPSRISLPSHVLKPLHVTHARWMCNTSTLHVLRARWMGVHLARARWMCYVQPMCCKVCFKTKDGKVFTKSFASTHHLLRTRARVKERGLSACTVQDFSSLHHMTPIHLARNPSHLARKVDPPCTQHEKWVQHEKVEKSWTVQADSPRKFTRVHSSSLELARRRWCVEAKLFVKTFPSFVLKHTSLHHMTQLPCNT